MTVPTIAALDPPAAPAHSAGKAHGAAQQFEALLIGQLLKSAREAGGGGWLGAGDDDDAGETGVEVAEQELARLLATKGGFGLARMVEGAIK